MYITRFILHSFLLGALIFFGSLAHDHDHARIVDQAALYRNLHPSAVGIIGTGTLITGQSYFSANLKYTLIFQEDGNLVLYGPTGSLWWSGTHGNGNACVMEADGNLVIYNNGSPTWKSHTSGNPGANIIVTDTGSLVISDQNSNMIKAYGVEGINGNLEKGKRYESLKKTHSLVFQQDGNLVLYGPTGPLWWSNTHFTNGDYCVMQADGNLVIYNNGSPKWQSRTSGNPGSYFTVFDTGVFVIYDKDGKMLQVYGREARVSGTLSIDQPYFSPSKLHHFIFHSGGSLVAYRSGIEFFNSKTNGNGDSCVMQTDGNLVIFNKLTPSWYSGTSGNPGAYLAITDKGILAIYNQSGVMLKYYGQEIITGWITQNHKFYSPNMRHWFIFQSDGHLILYNDGELFWSTGAFGRGSYCFLQTDGNLLIMMGTVVLWHSGTHGNPGAYITIDDDGWLNIHDASGNVIKQY